MTKNALFFLVDVSRRTGVNLENIAQSRKDDRVLDHRSHHLVRRMGLGTATATCVSIRKAPDLSPHRATDRQTSAVSRPRGVCHSGSNPVPHQTLRTQADRKRSRDAWSRDYRDSKDHRHRHRRAPVHAHETDPPTTRLVRLRL